MRIGLLASFRGSDGRLLARIVAALVFVDTLLFAFASGAAVARPLSGPGCVSAGQVNLGQVNLGQVNLGRGDVGHHPASPADHASAHCCLVSAMGDGGLGQPPCDTSAASALILLSAPVLEPFIAQRSRGLDAASPRGPPLLLV